MNKGKAIIGWNPALRNGRDFRVVDRLDGAGQQVQWLNGALDPPTDDELAAGWEAWLERPEADGGDAVAVLAKQVEAIRQATGARIAEGFDALLTAKGIAVTEREASL